jgi:hypothetical protein
MSKMNYRPDIISVHKLVSAKPRDVKRLAKWLRVDGLAFDYDDLIMLVDLASADNGMVPK